MTAVPDRLRVGLFGILGSGNLGNDGSLDAMVTFVRARRPDTQLDFMCMGPEQMTSRYGVPSTHLQWYQAHAGSVPGVPAPLLKVAGRMFDTFRILAWVRRHDVVIVPGMGVLEATLPLRPWAFPYAMLCLGAAGRLAGTKVALISVGASVIRKRTTRWMITMAARLAHHRSYRDALSRDAMCEMGVDVSADDVYPDLAFALPVPPVRAPAGTVGVGVMAYFGGNDDRERADELHSSYVDTMKRFVRWLVDSGRQVRLFTGDPADGSVVAEILGDLRTHRPDLDPTRVVASPTPTLHDLMDQMAAVDVVVATRYHNVLCALALSRPTVSISYAAKNDVLMAELGLAGYCQPARSVDLDLLVEQFRDLEANREHLVATMTERNRAIRGRLDHQFDVLSTALLGIGSVPTLAGRPQE